MISFSYDSNHHIASILLWLLFDHKKYLPSYTWKFINLSVHMQQLSG